RRRHTRFSRDWSSDVCSSDLSDARALQDSLRERGEQGATAVERVLSGPRELGREGLGPEGIARQARALRFVPARLAASALFLAEIGRASCREGVQMPGTGGGA